MNVRTKLMPEVQRRVPSGGAWRKYGPWIYLWYLDVTSGSQCWSTRWFISISGHCSDTTVAPEQRKCLNTVTNLACVDAKG